MTREEIMRGFEAAGWRMGGRGDDDDVLVAYSGDLSIVAHAPEIGAADPAFELYDGQRNLAYWVRVVPTPRQAAVLLAEHGGPPHEERGRP
jgi:hypothetical protein